MKKIYLLLFTTIITTSLCYPQTDENDKIGMLEGLESNNTDSLYNENTWELKDVTYVEDTNEYNIPGLEESTISKKQKSIISVEEGYDENVVTIGEKCFVKVKEAYDTTKIKIGKKGLKIVEKGNGTEINIIDEEDLDDEFDIDTDDDEPKFNVHWAGVELGVNGFVTKNSSFNFGDNQFMDLINSKSYNININFLEYGINIAHNNFGIATGLGLEFNDYRFERNNNITINEQGITTELNYDSINLEKSKLSTIHLTIPLLFELQIPTQNNKKVFISAGVIGGFRIGTHTKVVYEEDGEKHKDKVRKDFNIPPLRYGFTVRVGYRALNLYANYEMTPIFEKNKGPELYPFSIGFIIPI